MKNFILVLVLASICFCLSSCVRTKRLLWWDKKTEESPAFIDEKNPLAIPPEYSVRPNVVVKSEE